VTRQTSLAIPIALAGLLAGCTVGPDYHTPKSDLPALFAAATPATNQPQNNGAIPTRWWETFGDAELTSLIGRAIANNLDLQIAVARIQAAEAAEAVVIGTSLPSAGGAAAAGFGTGANLTRSPLLPSSLQNASTASGAQIAQVVGFDAGWELDLFGQFRREIEAAKYDEQAAVEARNDVLVAVVANVARAYFDFRGFQMRLAVLNQNVRAAQQSLNFVQARFDIGITNQLDVTLAQRELATLQAQIGPLVSQLNAARYSIATLLGEYPESIAGEFSIPAMIPPLPMTAGVGLPIQLLDRRPDIRQAERQLAASTARIGVATADLFPHVDLTAAAGLQALTGHPASAAPMAIWAAGPAGAWSLLDFGTLDALVDIADYAQKEFLLSYKQTILQAVQQVDAAEQDYTEDQDSLRSLETALTAAQLAVQLATQRYDRGLTDYLNVLDAQRQEYQLEDQYAVEQQAAADSLVALYRALGGGWEDYQTVPSIPQPQPAILAAFRRLLNPGAND
jgi:NodT family efflux transporter outer membrane factor (OMF) lipoprotein